MFFLFANLRIERRDYVCVCLLVCLYVCMSVCLCVLEGGGVLCEVGLVCNHLEYR